jgi:hypothetical protein
MNHRAASSGVSNTLTTRVHSKLLAMNPQRFKFPQVLQSLAVGPFQIGFIFQVGDFAGQWPAGATGANENIPSPHHRAKTTLK